MIEDHWRVVLSQLEGSTARVSVVASEPYLWMGLLSQMNGNQLVFELVNQPELRLDHHEVLADILHRGGLYRFRTVGSTDAAHARRLILNQPAHMEVLQRRSYPRIHVAGDVSYWTKDDGRAIIRSDGRVLNLGAGGMALETTQPLAPGTRLMLKFEGDPGWRLGILEAEITRNTPIGGGAVTMAMAFRNLRPEVAAILFQIVQSRLLVETGFLESAIGCLE